MTAVRCAPDIFPISAISATISELLCLEVTIDSFLSPDGGVQDRILSAQLTGNGTRGRCVLGAKGLDGRGKLDVIARDRWCRILELWMMRDVA